MPAGATRIFWLASILAGKGRGAVSQDGCSGSSCLADGPRYPMLKCASGVCAAGSLGVGCSFIEKAFTFPFKAWQRPEFHAPHIDFQS